MKRNLFLLIATLLLPSFSSLAQSSLDADLSKAVSISYDGKWKGTGFYMLNDSVLYLCAAAHVIYKMNSLGNITDNLLHKQIQLKSYSHKDPSNKFAIVDVNLQNPLYIRRHESRDICVVRLAKYVVSTDDNSVIVSWLPNSNRIGGKGPLSVFEASSIRKFENLEHGNEIRIIGYPNSLDTEKKDGSKRFDFKNPMLQSGVISALSYDLRSILTNAPTFYGNSGGAALYRKEKFFLTKDKLGTIITYELIGVSVAHIPAYFTDNSNPNDSYDWYNSGYSIIVPIEYALELMD